MAPTAVRMVLVEGENGDGALVDEDSIDVRAEDAPTFNAADQVISAILGTREGAAEGGYQLASTGVTWRDPAQAAELRDALASRKIENVMLVSAFLAAAALAHSVGNETNYAQTALLFIEPDTATLAVVNSADGSVADIQTQPLPADDDAAVARLTELVSRAETLATHPDAVFVVGSGVDVPLIKPALDAATTLPVTLPEEPETALAWGAALASANTPLLSASTAARAYAQDPGTGAYPPFALDPAYFDNANAAEGALAYSAVGPEHDEPKAEGRRPIGLLGSVLLSIFVVGVASLVVSLAVSIRGTSSTRPDPGQALVAPTPAPQAPAPAPVPEQGPAPAPQAPAPVPEQAPAPAPQAPAPVPEQAPAPQVPVQVPQAPAPAPIQAPAPAPVPAAPAPVPVPVPIPQLPQIFTPQFPLGPGGGGGRGGDDDRGPGAGKGPGPKLPGGGGPGKGGKGGGGRGGFNIPGIPGF
ncbi:MAG: hypothetical protein EKK34_23685 [Mycobacterium sp.]|nr:MAG: hypothetical protein EKK34_23685 [Mycobacterium sp.]